LVDGVYKAVTERISSVLNVYELRNDEFLPPMQFYFSLGAFSHKQDMTLSNFFYDYPIHKVENGIPNPLDITTKKTKIYCYDDKLFLTIDNSTEKTKLLTIDLINHECNVKNYSQINISGEHLSRAKSNSYLFNNILFQIKGCKQELCFQLKDIIKDSLLVEYRVKEPEEIEFRNTPLLQEGGFHFYSQGLERELESTKQVLRKISASNIGISVFQSDENIELEIGGYMEFHNNGGSMMMYSGGTTFSTPQGVVSTLPTYHYNPTMYSFISYTNSRSVYFKTLLVALSFKHIEGSITENVYEKIRNFIEDNISDIISETIVKVSDYYILAYYDKSANKYYLRKFRNE
jgi:hypothetical protein